MTIVHPISKVEESPPCSLPSLHYVYDGQTSRHAQLMPSRYQRFLWCSWNNLQDSGHAWLALCGCGAADGSARHRHSVPYGVVHQLGRWPALLCQSTDVFYHAPLMITDIKQRFAKLHKDDVGYHPLTAESFQKSWCSFLDKLRFLLTLQYQNVSYFVN